MTIYGSIANVFTPSNNLAENLFRLRVNNNNFTRLCVLSSERAKMIWTLCRIERLLREVVPKEVLMVRTRKSREKIIQP